MKIAFLISIFYRHDMTEMLLKVELNTTPPVLSILQWKTNITEKRKFSFLRKFN